MSIEKEIRTQVDEVWAVYDYGEVNTDLHQELQERLQKMRAIRNPIKRKQERDLILNDIHRCKYAKE